MPKQQGGLGFLGHGALGGFRLQQAGNVQASPARKWLGPERLETKV